jgi:hypothetical protein
VIDWLFSDAGAGWVFGTASLIALLIGYLRRSRPSIVVVRELARTSLVSVRPEVRDDIEVRFRGQALHNLAQLELECTNIGSSVVRNAAITLRFSDGTEVLDVGHLSPDATPECSFRKEATNVRVEIPFLNPETEHRHRVHFAVLLSGIPQPVSVTGAGEGWSTRHLPIPSMRALQRRMTRLMLLMLGWLAVSGGGAYILGSQDRSRIGRGQYSRCLVCGADAARDGWPDVPVC